MIITKIINRKFSAIGRNKSHEDFIGELITTKDIIMDTGYIGRGLPSKQHSFKSGTKCTFKISSHKNSDLETITGFTLESSFDGFVYSFTKNFKSDAVSVVSDILRLNTHNIKKVVI